MAATIHHFPGCEPASADDALPLTCDCGAILSDEQALPAVASCGCRLAALAACPLCTLTHLARCFAAPENPWTSTLLRL